MEARELRIGNYVRLKNSDIEECIDIIDAFYPDDAWVHLEGNGIKNKLNEIEPIPLTEEWLLNLGFNRVDHIHGYSFYVHSLVKLAIYDNGMVELRGTAGWTKMLYVHQLQNLFFALTGKELEIKK